VTQDVASSTATAVDQLPHGPPASLRERVSQGMAWNAGMEVAQVLVSLGAMLVLVRLVSAEDYGRVATATAILKVVSAFSMEPFAQHILLLPPGHAPDWGMHWRAGLRLNGTLALVALSVGVGLLATPYAGVAVLVLVGAVGLVTGLPFTLAMVGFQRDLDFRRYRLWGFSSQLLGHVVAVTCAVFGAGALGIVLGTSAVRYVPLAWHWIRSGIMGPWRSWPRAVPWTRYRDSLRFGAQGISGVLLTQAQQTAEGLLVPSAFGFATLGLLGRASSLFQQTAGRVAQVATDTVYPFLPRAAHDPVAFARQGRFVVQAGLAFAGVAAVYFWVAGPSLSRVLYGATWAAADSFILPFAIYGSVTIAGSLAKLVPLAAGRLRVMVVLNALDATLAVAAVTWATLRGTPSLYPWALAMAQGVSLVVACVAAHRIAGGGRGVALLWPAVIGGAAAWGAATGSALLVSAGPALAAVSALVVPVGVVVAWRLTVPQWLSDALSVLPYGQRARTWLRLA
jgi:O-antigen/teichoic acid export membrane protein